MLADAIDAIATRTGFSGVVRVDLADTVEFDRAYGFADHAHGIGMTTDTRLAVASASKFLTALAVMSLVADGTMSLSTPARTLLGPDLPLIDGDATVEHLLSHRSGIGDYLDEDGDHQVDAFLPVSVHQLATTADFLPLLDGHRKKFAAGERFCYCNSGFVVLALIVERVTGVSFHDVVRQRVCEPAGLMATDFLRSDCLPGTAALGYVDTQWRTNVFHLPVLGSGDGGMYSTTADIIKLWKAFFEGRIVADEAVAEMLRPRSVAPSRTDPRRYGLGVWLHATTPTAIIDGSDAGVSCRSHHDPIGNRTFTVISNTSSGAWTIARELMRQFPD